MKGVVGVVGYEGLSFPRDNKATPIALTVRVLFASQGHLTSIFTASLIDALGDWTCRQQVLVARWSGVVLHVLRGSGNTSLVSVEFISKQIFKCNPSSKPFFYIWAIYGDVAIIHISKKV